MEIIVTLYCLGNNDKEKGLYIFNTKAFLFSNIFNPWSNPWMYIESRYQGLIVSKYVRTVKFSLDKINRNKYSIRKIEK
jgi:hypothetical protein